MIIGNDRLAIGDLLSENYIEQYHRNKSASIGQLYNFKWRTDLTPQSANVRNTGGSDSSNVYEVITPRIFESILEDAQEELTSAIRKISTDHAYIHDGLGYRTYFEIGSVTTTEEFLILPNDTKYLHFKNLELMALGGTCKVTLLRGTTANPLVIDSAGVTASEVIGPNNVNDNSEHTSGVTITKTPTYVTAQAGEPWAILQVLGDSTNQFTSVAKTQSNPEEEFVLKPDTPYVLKVERIGSDTPNNVLLTAFWYEEAQGTTE